MKYSVAAVFAAVAGASAHAGNVTWVTETVDIYSTYCPGPTEITNGGKTHTVTTTGWFTITDCPCTVTKPVTTSTEVACHTCAGAPPPPAMSTPAVAQPAPPAGTGSVVPPAETPSTPPSAAGAGKVAAISGAGLAGVVGLAAFIL